jgi:hypothetical protein
MKVYAEEYDVAVIVGGIVQVRDICWLRCVLLCR